MHITASPDAETLFETYCHIEHGAQACQKAHVSFATLACAVKTVWCISRSAMLMCMQIIACSSSMPIELIMLDLC